MIIAQAGRKGAVTVATNMAGRGVDILLGGNPEFLAKEEAGPPPDPRDFQRPDPVLRLLRRRTLPSFRRSEAHPVGAQGPGGGPGDRDNFSIRKRLLEYDQVMARQREAVYALRNRFLLGRPDEDRARADLDEYLEEVIENYAQALLQRHCPDPDKPYDWDLQGLLRELRSFQSAPLSDAEAETLTEGAKYPELEEAIRTFLRANLEAQRERLGAHFSPVAIGASTSTPWTT